jgi:hypothetical protein
VHLRAVDFVATNDIEANILRDEGHCQAESVRPILATSEQGRLDAVVR